MPGTFTLLGDVCHVCGHKLDHSICYAHSLLDRQPTIDHIDESIVEGLFADQLQARTSA